MPGIHIYLLFWKYFSFFLFSALSMGSIFFDYFRLFFDGDQDFGEMYVLFAVFSSSWYILRSVFNLKQLIFFFPLCSYCSMLTCYIWILIIILSLQFDFFWLAPITNLLNMVSHKDLYINRVSFKYGSPQLSGKRPARFL